VFCEPWSSSTWWQNGYDSEGGKTFRAAQASQVTYTSLVSTGCISGTCLKVSMPQGTTNSLSIHWPLKNAGIAPDQLYFRYYIKLGPNWNPYMTDGSAGGKFPGLADARSTHDPSGQCGNGGDIGDGINCWTARASFYDCTSNMAPDCSMRYGSYLYFYRQQFGDGSFTGLPGQWDNDPRQQFTGDGGTCQSTANNVFCGIGNGGDFVNDRWYRVEEFIKMNTPGVANGIIRGWIDGVLSYEKTNMIFRIPGHDNLHVRTVWLNVYKGGVLGNLNSSEIFLDQMVLATDAPIGAVSPGSPQIPAAPTGLTLQ
jgi:hypothetical protein